MEKVLEKFNNNIEGVLPREKAEEIMECVKNFELLESVAVLIEKMQP